MKNRFIICKINKFTDEVTYYNGLHFCINSSGAYWYLDESSALSALENVIEEGETFYIQTVYVKG